MLAQTDVVKTVQQYANAVRQTFQPEAVILYGSYAKGTAREDSDIDVPLYSAVSKATGWMLPQSCGSFAEISATKTMNRAFLAKCCARGV